MLGEMSIFFSGGAVHVCHHWPYFITPIILGGSRKYPYRYHGRHLGIPKGRGGVTSTGIPRTSGGGYVDWNSEDMGRVHWTGIPKAYGGFQESNFQFGVVKSLQQKLVKTKDDDSLVNTRHVHLNQHAGDTFQW